MPGNIKFGQWARGFVVLVFVLLGWSHDAEATGRRLSNASSPYLRQHAEDRIAWFAWGAEALETARAQNRLIFVSVGYSTCHWCHVQSRTTFADDRVVELLNRNFVSILVDREARPDLDAYFQDVMLSVHGQGGWPANLVLTPEGIPIFATGYAPAERAGSAWGFLATFQNVLRVWARKAPALRRDGLAMRRAIEMEQRDLSGDASVNRTQLRQQAVTQWMASHDDAFGGFGRDAKFLNANALWFLLGEAVSTGDDQMRARLLSSLDHMAAGGIRDQLGGGFHRYAVGRFWQVPHFEMPLADNAMLARVYLRAYRVSGRDRYAQIARGILDTLLTRFRLAGGGFASALDGDSGGGEGFYYTWTEDEIRVSLGGAAAEPFIQSYLHPKIGRLKGRAILRVQKGKSGLDEALDQYADERRRLAKARRSRPAPARDDKMLVDWNGLTIGALALAAQVLEDARYERAAVEVADMLIANYRRSGRLSHDVSADGGPVFLTDYAYLADGLVDLFEATFNSKYLDAARALVEDAARIYEVEETGLLRIAGSDAGAGDIPDRVVFREDGLASGTAALVMAINRLSLFAPVAEWSPGIARIRQAANRAAAHHLGAAPMLLAAGYFAEDAAREIVIIGDPAGADTKRLLAEVRRRPLNGVVVAVLSPDGAGSNGWHLLAARPQLDGKATAYLCRRQLCLLPTTSLAEFAGQLEELAPRQIRISD
ncbi:MAG: thioredoxin domain-containing protein [Rhodospirillaceae bacterium]|nr:thioredoxin domain-containing protein [Rhodospirillaceae bacterium]